HPGASFNLGKGLVYRDPAAAEAHLRRAIASNPNFAGGHYELGMALAIQRAAPQAEASLRRAIELDRTRPGPYAALASTLMIQGRRQEAAENAELALRLLGGTSNPDPDDVIILDHIGAVFERANRIGDALETC